ncbi:RimK domain protein ATP-grasp [Neorhizobium galegae bv. orientalis]|nr:RimK domain protein ATP-grasp [Neorhizobium galegae bv. orientalis]
MLSNLADLSTDRICYHLSTMGVQFLRLNREQLPDLGLQIDPLRARLTCHYGDHLWRVGAKLRSVWWRQPTFLRNTPGRALTVEEQLDRSQWSAAMRGLMLFDEPRWFNDPAMTYRAESKPYQLREAYKLGFDVPETLVTNDRLADIPGRLGTKLVIKSVDTVLLSEGSNQHFGYTVITDWSDCADGDFHTIPVTCQALLSPKLDLRVTIVGERLWCSTVETGEGGIEGDWRLRPKVDLVYKEHQLPVEVEQRCRALLGVLGLRYGAIDLALSAEKYWFIEINPTGEWGWLDRDGRGISEAIAVELASEVRT